jgi:hypothetical protein
MKNGIELKVTKENPKEGAITYNINSIEMLFSVLNGENVDSFCKDFKALIVFKDFIDAVATAKLPWKEFTWTDD